ncbi:MAG UNVERIFIED_CONTAM: hypothetical protein LVR29_08330 [Microcystis novacekii LVE1205-3]
MYYQASLWKYQEETKTITEMIETYDGIRISLCNEVGEWRLPLDGTLFQKDILFVRKNLFWLKVKSFNL